MEETIPSINTDNDNLYSTMKNGSTVKPESDKDRREIGQYGIWTLSSVKAGNGVEQLLEDNTSSFWQSDGLQPHTILIQFLKKFRVSEIWIYLDAKTDESYTPSKISIKVANSFNEFVEVRLIDFEDPIGWFKISLEERNMKGEIIKPYLKSMGIQICILQNIHNGRDTHIRQIKIFSPREHRSYDFNFPKFESNEFKQYMYIR